MFKLFELERGQFLQGEISSDSLLDIYFMNLTNFRKWEKDRTFSYEWGTEQVCKTTINCEVPRKGTWFLTIDNIKIKNAKVEVELFIYNPSP